MTYTHSKGLGLFLYILSMCSNFKIIELIIFECYERGKQMIMATPKSQPFLVVVADQSFSNATNRCQFKLRSGKAENSEGLIFQQLFSVAPTDVWEWPCLVGMYYFRAFPSLPRHRCVGTGLMETGAWLNLYWIYWFSTFPSPLTQYKFRVS